jgi:hypothetical protein
LVFWFEVLPQGLVAAAEAVEDSSFTAEDGGKGEIGCFLVIGGGLEVEGDGYVGRVCEGVEV